MPAKAQEVCPESAVQESSIKRATRQDSSLFSRLFLAFMHDKAFWLAQGSHAGHSAAFPPSSPPCASKPASTSRNKMAFYPAILASRSNSLDYLLPTQAAVQPASDGIRRDRNPG